MKDGFRIYDTHCHLGTARHSGRRHTAHELLLETEMSKILGLDAPAEAKRDILWNTASRVIGGAS